MVIAPPPLTVAVGVVGAASLVAWARASLPGGSVTVITKKASAAPAPARRNPATISRTRVPQLRVDPCTRERGFLVIPGAP